MPIISVTPLPMRDGTVISQYKNTVHTSPETFTFQKPQEWVVLYNKGTADLIYTIGTQSGTLKPAQSVEVKQNINSFILSSVRGTQAFEIRSDEEGSNLPGAGGSVPVDVSERLNEFDAQLAKKLNKDETLSFEKSKNLFNKDDIIPDVYVSFVDGMSSSGQSNTSYVASNFIKINPSMNYTINYFDQIAWYDVNQNFVSGINGYQQGAKTITSPTNAEYIRVSVHKPKLLTYQLEEGSVSTSFTPYGFRVIKDDRFNALTMYKSIQSVMSKLVKSDTPINVKLLGDSITQGMGGTGFAQDGELIWTSWQSWYVNTNGHCWANSLKDYFQEKFNCVVKNYGMSGIGSTHILEAIDTIVEDDDDIIILMIGTNDRNNSPGMGSSTNLVSNLNSIVDYVTGKGKEIILMSSIPSSITNETDNKNFHMEDVDHIIMKVASENNMEYVSVYKQFIDYCDNKSVTIDSLLTDGIHPNDAGYDVMFSLICHTLGFGTKRDSSTW
jgi:lysophospholipase L1-like esterase